MVRLVFSTQDLLGEAVYSYLEGRDQETFPFDEQWMDISTVQEEMSSYKQP